MSPALNQRTLPLLRPIIDASDWPVVSIEQMGSKPKRWLLGPTGARWLFKELTSNKSRAGTTFLRGDDWSEVISSEIARALGLATATVELARWGERQGVLSLSIAHHASLIHGNEVMSAVYPGYANASRHNPMYTVDAAMRIMQAVKGPPYMPVGAPTAFAGYLLLDALVGNTDRHHENWALLQKQRHAPQLAPSFDHASSLGFLLSDEERYDRLTTSDQNRTVQAYAARAQTPFADAKSPRDAALRAVRLLAPPRRKLLLSAIDDVDEAVNEAVDCVPESKMSDLARTFALQLVKLNRRSLIGDLREVA